MTARVKTPVCMYTQDKTWSSIFDCGERLPTMKTIFCPTTEDDQSEIWIDIGVGVAPDVKPIVRFRVAGIPPGAKGSHIADVMITMDEGHGISNVVAILQSTKQKLTVMMQRFPAGFDMQKDYWK